MLGNKAPLGLVHLYMAPEQGVHQSRQPVRTKTPHMLKTSLVTLAALSLIAGAANAGPADSARNHFQAVASGLNLRLG